MHLEPKALLKEAIRNCLPVLQSLVEGSMVPHLGLRKTGEEWNHEVELPPLLMPILNAAHETISEAGQRFAESFFTRHPECQAIGLPALGLFNLEPDILRSAFAHLWSQYETFQVGEVAVDALIGEFEAFVDSLKVRLIFRSQLLNFRTPGDSIDLPEGLRIRRMNDKDVSAFHGGPIAVVMVQPKSWGIHEFCIEGKVEEHIVVKGLKSNERRAMDRLKARLDKAILCLRTFKEGRVGYDRVHFYPLTFFPLPLPSYGYGDLYVPPGDYTLSTQEFGSLAEYAVMFFGVSEPSIELACSRLADAEMRAKPEDRLVDAVIGMEALLLAGLDRESRRGELRFRFALNYSTLFGTPEERRRAFRRAKHLYDLRSGVVHGSALGDRASAVVVGDEKLKLPEAAKRASETLRHLVRHFLPMVKEAPYKRPEFWEKAYFRLPGLVAEVPDAEAKGS
jgi:hypothetical protein